MIDLGGELRQAREAAGISLAEAEVATRIKERYLKALETNDWAALPTQVQARGFLRNYAVYLGLDGDEVMASFGQVMRGTAATLPPPPASGSPVRTTSEEGVVFNPRNIEIERVVGLPVDIIVGVVLAVVVVLVGYGLFRLVSGDASASTGAITATPEFTPAMMENPLAPTTDPGVTPDAVIPVLVTPTFDTGTGSVQLVLEATEHVWVRVTVDGVIVLEGILAPGTPETWQGAQEIALVTANGAGLKAVVNGQTLESLGERGETMILAWGPSGPVTPAPTTAP